MTEINSKENAVEIILEIWDLMERIGYGELKAARVIGLCELYNHRALRLEPWVYESVDQLSPTTLKKWRQPTRKRGQGKRGSGCFAKGTFCHDQANHLLARYSGVTPSRIYWVICNNLPNENYRKGTSEAVPHKRSVQRYVKAWRRLESLLPEGVLQRQQMGEKYYDSMPSLALFVP